METTKQNNKSLITSLIVHIILVILLLLPLLSKIEKEDPQGILIAFGDMESGMMSEEPQQENSSSTQSLPPPTTSNQKQENIKSDTRDDISPIKATDKKDNKPKAEEKKQKTESTEETLRKKTDADKVAREAEERAKAEKEAQDRANQKKKYSDLFGKGQGNNNTTGNQGTDKGSPDGKALEGITKGSGRVGGGLSGRGIEFEPTFTDNSQKTGKVNLSICVDENGKVVKAEFTQRGSTTSDSYLIELAKKSALKYKFSKSDNELQCGTVLIDFKVK